MVNKAERDITHLEPSFKIAQFLNCTIVIKAAIIISSSYSLLRPWADVTLVAVTQTLVDWTG